MLSITYSMRNRWNYVYDLKSNFSTGDWRNLKISQIDNVYEIKIDGKSVHKANNPSPKSWKNIKVVSGNTYDNPNFLPAVGKYRNFFIKSPIQNSKLNKFTFILTHIEIPLQQILRQTT